MRIDGNGGGKRPQYRVKLGPANSEGKIFWTDVGGAWVGKDGMLSLRLNDGVSLVINSKMNRLILTPNEPRPQQQQTSHVLQNEDGVSY
jgi:hypothetical protein